MCVIDCQTGIVLHKYKAPGEVSARALLLQGSRQSPGRSATYSSGDLWMLGLFPRLALPLGDCSTPPPPRSSSLWPGQP